jgi:FtsZ-interacting cell division protein ZipA
MSELRWWLLILGVAFFAGLVVWELRRPRQARKGDALPEATRPRESSLQLPEMHALESLTSRTLPLVELPDDTAAFPLLEAAPPETGAEALSSPQDDTATPEDDSASQSDGGEPQDSIEPEHAATPAEESQRAAAPHASAPRDLPPQSPAAPATRVEWPPDEERRVVALRLVAPQPERFPGRSLRQALAAEGFVLWRFDIFHKPDDTQRAILSAASLTRPGTFDAQTMDSQHFGGLSLFAVLPGPMSPPKVFEELVTTARNLNDRLCGVLQDEGGTPLTPARIASLREWLSGGALS